jgi:hypothetical protein
MSQRLDAYLVLERVMLDLDGRSDPLADQLRDAMDSIWYSLSEGEHAYLDSRRILEVHSLNPVTLSADLRIPISRDGGAFKEIRGLEVGLRLRGSLA